MEKLTEKQQRILSFIEKRLNDNSVPTQREIAAHFGLAQNAVCQLIGYLREKGYLENTSGHRGLRLSKAYIDNTKNIGGLLILGRVAAGFPSPAADYQEDRLDLNKYLIKNPPATFFVRASGESMIGAGINNGDLLVVDRSLEPKDKSVVIAVVNGEFNVKRLRIIKKKVVLQSENENYPDQQISEDAEFEVWGVVTNVIHSL